MELQKTALHEVCLYFSKNVTCILTNSFDFCQKMTIYRAVARSENPGGHIVLGGDNVHPLVEIGLTDLPKSTLGFISVFISPS